MLSSSEVLQAIIKDSKNIEAIRTLTTSDVTYVSLNYDHPNLKKIMPWCGTSKGPDSIVQTFTDVSRYWETFDFKEEALFEAGENAAMFGQFTYRSVVLKKTVTSPFSVFAKVRNSWTCFGKVESSFI
jgi:hypothetical protein